MTTPAPQNQPFDPNTVIRDLAGQLATALANCAIAEARAATAYQQLEETRAELREALQPEAATPETPPAPTRR